MKGEKKQYGALAKAIHGIDVLDSTVGDGVSSAARRTIYDIDIYRSPKSMFFDNWATSFVNFPDGSATATASTGVPSGMLYLVVSATFTTGRANAHGQANMRVIGQPYSAALFADGPITPLSGDVVDCIAYAMKPIVVPPGYYMQISNNVWQAGDTSDVVISYYEVEL